MKQKTLGLLSCVLLLACAGCVSGTQPRLAGKSLENGIVVEIPASRAETPPEINGVLDDVAWQVGKWTGDFVETGWLEPAQPETFVKISYDREALYLAFRCMEPDTGSLRKAPVKRDGPVWRNDCVEIWLIPSKLELAYHIIVDSNGTVWDASELENQIEWKMTRIAAWNSRISVCCKVYDGYWTVEMKLPLHELGIDTDLDRGAIWRCNLGRERYAGVTAEVSSISGTFADFHDKFGYLFFK